MRFNTQRGVLTAVRDVSFAVGAAETLGVVGESGSGKTQLFMAAMGLLPRATKTAGSVKFNDQEILGAPLRHLNEIRGSKLSMVFQDPMSSLTPHLRIGIQLAEVLQVHQGSSRREALAWAAAMMERVRIPDVKRRLRQYPHELSGGHAPARHDWHEPCSAVRLW